MALVGWSDDAVNATGYVTRAEADAYHTDNLAGAAWAAASTADRDAAVVTATRMLDRQLWQGTRTSATQPLDWPRTGVTDAEGTAVDNATIPDAILNACSELALGLINDSTLAASAAAGSNTKRVKAGSAEVEYFRSTFGEVGRFPTIVQEYVREFLAASTSAGGFAYGTDQDSTFEDATLYDVTEP